MFRKKQPAGLADILTTDLAATYQAGRSHRWLKFQWRLEAEFMIRGCTVGRHGVSSMLVGTAAATHPQFAGIACLCIEVLRSAMLAP